MSRLQAVALASQSPRRKQLLEGLGLQVSVVASAFQEDSATQSDPRELAFAFARAKADQAEASGPPVLIAADTIVVLDGEWFGKPSNSEHAKMMLRRLSGHEHVVHTGFTVLDRASGRREDGVETTFVRFLPLTEEEIDGYVATGDPLDKAGAYGIQGRGGLLVSSIHGDFYNVMGLPLARIGLALKNLGHDVLAR